LKIKVKGLGEFQLTPGIPLKSLIPEIKKISSKLPVGFKYNQEYIDWHFSFNEKNLENLELEPIFSSDEEALIFLRHTASHALAQAVKELFPGAKLGIGPPTEDGFYYDIYYEKPFNEEDLQKIEERIKEIIKKDLPLERKEIPKEEAKELFKNLKEDFKLELIEELPDSKVSIYSQENFIDLCKGPHLLSTGEIKAVKLLSVAGAYWRGNEKNPMLWRIYGTAFFSEEELKAYLDRLEEIKRRDHRRLGKELELFTIEEDIGPGL
jgi:threonyl-tRNA synthetase (EC 6.1.1.3)/Ser-tRNA(Thr) hydrolase (EC 3.1.1.-)